MTGYYRYHAVPGNIDSVFGQRLRRLWWLILRRRSQRPVPWERVIPISARWIPAPAFCIPILSPAFSPLRRDYSRWEPRSRRVLFEVDVVGTIITDRPVHRSIRELLRSRLPPWILSLGRTGIRYRPAFAIARPVSRFCPFLSSIMSIMFEFCALLVRRLRSNISAKAGGWASDQAGSCGRVSCVYPTWRRAYREARVKCA